MFSLQSFKQGKFIIELEDLEDKLLINFIFDNFDYSNKFYAMWQNNNLSLLEVSSFNELPKLSFSNFFSLKEVQELYNKKLTTLDWKDSFKRGGIALKISNVDKIEDLLFELKLKMNGNLFDYLSEEDDIICINNAIDWHFGTKMKIVKF